MKIHLKHLGSLFMLCLLSYSLLAQVPQQFNFQGIARDAQGNPMSKQRLSLKLSVLPSADAPVAEYEEIQNVTTNEFGLYTLQIGNGSPLIGEMKSVPWETGNKYIRVAIDPKGGNNFTELGTTQLLSVPYAIYADRSGTAKSVTKTTRGTNNFIEKTDGSGNVNATSQIFDNGANIGIGTITPSARLHISANSTNVLEHVRMQNANANGAGRFTMYGDGASSYSTFTKYGSNYAGNYAGLTGLYPYANLLAFGNNGLVAGDGLGRFLISSAGNIGLSLFKGGTSKLKLHIDYTTERVGIGNNITPAAPLHISNANINDTVKFTNGLTGHTASDGFEIRTNGNNARLINRENAYLLLGTNNTDRVAINGAGNVGIGTITPTTALDVNGQIRMQGGNPGIGKIMTSDSTGIGSWSSTTDAGLISGTGTTNVVPLFTPNGNTLGNSLIKDSSGFMYNSNGMPDQYTGAYFVHPINKTSFNIHVGHPITYNHNYINLTSTSGSPYMGLHFSDSARYYNWFNGLGGNPDSIGSIYYTKDNNRLFLGNAIPNKGFTIRVNDGRMGNVIGNAMFAIQSNYDTAGYFTSWSSNTLANGILRADYTGSTVANHIGIYGKVSNASGYGNGVTGEGNWIGVRGISSDNTAFCGVYGNAPTTGVMGLGNVNGVLADLSAGATNTSVALKADATGTNGVGIRAASDSNQAGLFTASGNGGYCYALDNGVLRGVYSGVYIQDAVGVFGSSIPNVNNNYGIGVSGEGGYMGVRGRSASTSGAKYGVYGISTGPGTNYGVTGIAYGGTLNYAGYFDGTLYATTGTFGTKPFTIDHPLDPENKVLRHSSIESPDMMNIYNGNIITDANGYATVTLPDYFEVLNRDFKYQLTVIDNSADFIQAKVTRKVSGNTFEIRTSQSNVEVSWQISGVRQDAVAKKYPVIVEEMKPEGIRGKYYEPEAYGKPAAMAIFNPEEHASKEEMKTIDYKENHNTMREQGNARSEALNRDETLLKESQKNHKEQTAPPAKPFAPGTGPTSH